MEWGPRDAPATVFLHGRFAGALTWDGVRRALGPRCHGFAVEFPPFSGAGGSTIRGAQFLELARAAREVIQRLVGPGAWLVGHDSGGTLALVLLADPSVAAFAAVPINPIPPTAPVVPMTWLEEQRFLGSLHAFVHASRLPAHLRAPLLALWENRAESRRALRAIHALARTWPGHHQRAFWKTELRARAARIFPLWGAHDPLNSLAVGRAHLDALGLTPEVDPNSSHWPPLENPEWVAHRLEDAWLRSARRSLSR